MGDVDAAVLKEAHTHHTLPFPMLYVTASFPPSPYLFECGDSSPREFVLRVVHKISISHPSP